MDGQKKEDMKNFNLRVICLILFSISIFAVVPTLYFLPPQGAVTHFETPVVQMEQINPGLKDSILSWNLTDCWTTNLSSSESRKSAPGIYTDSSNKNTSYSKFTYSETDDSDSSQSILIIDLYSLNVTQQPANSPTAKPPQFAKPHFGFTKTKIAILTVLTISSPLSLVFLLFPPWEYKQYSWSLKEFKITADENNEISVATGLKRTIAVAKAFAAAPCQVTQSGNSRNAAIPSQEEHEAQELELTNNLTKIVGLAKDNTVHGASVSSHAETSTSAFAAANFLTAETSLPFPATTSTVSRKKSNATASISSLGRSLSKKINETLKGVNEIEIQPIIRITHPLETITVHQGLNRLDGEMLTRVEQKKLSTRSRRVLGAIDMKRGNYAEIDEQSIDATDHNHPDGSALNPEKALEDVGGAKDEEGW